GALLEAIAQPPGFRRMCRVHESAAAAGGDLLDALGILVPLVEMQIAGEEHAHLALENLLFEKPGARFLLVAGMARIGFFQYPARLGNAEEELRWVVHAGGDALEILHLRLVELRAELQ